MKGFFLQTFSMLLAPALTRMGLGIAEHTLRAVAVVILVLSGTWVQANPVLDLLEGKTDGRDLFPQYFEEKPVEVAPTQEQVVPVPEKRPYIPSKFPERPVPVSTLYRNDKNRIVQEVAVEGHAEYNAVSSQINQPSGNDKSVSDWRLNVATLGAAAHLLYFADLEARVAFDGGGYAGLERFRLTLDVTDPMIPVHNTLQRAFQGAFSLLRGLLSPLSLLQGGEQLIPDVSTNALEAAQLRIGKYRPRFGSQYGIDPTLRITPDLPELVAQIAPANALGVEYIEYNDFWNWRAGWFSNSLDAGLPSVQDGGIITAGVGYNFGVIDEEKDGVIDKFQEFRFDYIYNSSGDGSEIIPYGYDHLFALSYLIQGDRFSLSTDFIGALGENSQEAWGVNVTTGYWLVRDFLQLVGQYEHAGANNNEGLVVNWGAPTATTTVTHPLFDNRTSRTGNRYNSLYTGLNMYFLEQRLRIGAGFEYRMLNTTDSASGHIDSWMWQGQGVLAF